MQNLTVQKICLVLITLAFFVAAPWITSETLGGNSMPLVVLGGTAVLLLLVYGLGDRCWLLIPFCLSIEGNLNFLPINFSMQELAIITVFCYLLFRMIFGLDVSWHLGPAILWIPLAGVLGVLLYHWIRSGDIGIKILGGTGWGGRKYFTVMLATVCVPLLASFPGMKWQDLQKVPFLFFLGTFIDLIPDAISTFAPATAPYIWRIYSGVNLAEFGETLRGNFLGEEGISRVRNLGKLGTAISLVILCYFPAKTWLHPTRLWAFPLVLFGGILCAVSGFRNTVFRYFLSLLAGLFAYMRWRALLVIPAVIGAALAISLTHGKIFHYPLALQRALSFLPGEWDFMAKRSAEGSSEWRGKMKELFFKEYFPKSPLLGVGYHYNPELAKRDTDIFLSIAARQAQVGDEFADVRSYIEQRMPHEGPVHILLVTGTTGSLFFILFCASLCWYALRDIFQTKPAQITPIQVWAFALIIPQVAGFFIVFGELTTFFIQVCPIAILLYRAKGLKMLHGNHTPQDESAGMESWASQERPYGTPRPAQMIVPRI